MVDVVVVGGGTVGLATAWRLAERGASVTVVDPHAAPHEYGSHAGYTRVTRHAYHEGSGYVPLVQEADRAWCALEPSPGALLVRTGMLEFGPRDDPGFSAALAACDAHDLEHEMLTAAQVRARHPVVLPEGWEGCFTPTGGYLRVGPCLEAMRARAVDLGARIRSGTAALHLEPGRVHTSDGVLEADAVVLAAGSRVAELLPASESMPLRRLRRLLFWIRPATGWMASAQSLPVWGAFTPDGFFYGFPPGHEGIDGMKVACHTSASIPGLDDPVQPDAFDRSVRPEDWGPVEACLRAHLPAAGVERIDHRACLYTATDSWDFLLDRHPGDPRLIVAAGFSGHGFKFAPTLGRLAADLVLGGGRPHPGFAWDRHRSG
ncbi:MAG: N-methyl-L-tryptophan oxidase [Myxococcota bacterium]